jgi:hypothetical protein
MITIEEHVQKIVEAHWDDRPMMIHKLAQRMLLLHAALPAPFYLDSVANQLELTCAQVADLSDGTTFNGAEYLRRAAQLVRGVINEEMKMEERVTRAMSAASRVESHTRAAAQYREK